MDHLIYDYTDLKELKKYFSHNIKPSDKLIVQIHTDKEEVINNICAFLIEFHEALQIVPVLQKNIFTKLYISRYPHDAVLTARESFLEHDLYKAIIDSTKEGFWLLDEKLNIISINNAFANMLGYEKQELIGKKPFELFALVDEQQTFCEEQADLAFTSVQRSYELTFVSKNKKSIHTIVNATTMQLPENQTRTFAFITDISEQKELEQRLLEQQHNINTLNEELSRRVETEVQANRRKDQIMYQQARLATMGEMVANIAHQWRQPLNIIALIMQEFYISGQLGTLDREKLEKEYTRANSVLQYMSNTIDDFRSFFKHNDEGERFDIDNAVNSVLTLVSKAMEHNNIEITTEIEAGLSVFGHKNEFVQALINLLNNAREAIVAHAEKGSIAIKAYTEGQQIKLSVQDSGGGIQTKEVDQIFEPYFTTKHQTQGTGLGLYMTHQIIVNNMKGSIYAENREGGTCFCISLPKETPEELAGS